MSKCCKGKCWCKYLPHNWLCLKGLSVVFTVLFYIALVISVYVAWSVFSYFFTYVNGKGFFSTLFTTLTTWQMWVTIGIAWAQTLGAALFLLTVSKILKVLYKIKQAVAPCECQKEQKSN